MIGRFTLFFLATAFGSAAPAAPLDHTFSLTLNHSSGVSFAIPPSIAAVEVTAPTLAGGGPLHEQNPTEVTNPLYTGLADPGSPGSVIGVTLTLGDAKSSLRGGGVVHRDVAARNVLITTNEGVYEMEAGGVLVFMNDGPEDLRGIGPVRWMAPESLRSRTYPTDPGDARSGWWEIAAFSYYEVSYPVPEPSAGSLAACLGAAARRRRRRAADA